MRKSILSIFPYRTDTSGNTFPVVPIALEYAGKKREFVALVDSGASISVFRGEIAEILAIPIENGEETFLGGVGGRIKGYIHRVKVEIAGKRFVCPIVFSYEYLVSVNLLGRQEFFKKFRIIFEEQKRRIILN